MRFMEVLRGQYWFHTFKWFFFAGINSWKVCKHCWSCEITKESFRSKILLYVVKIAPFLSRKPRYLCMHSTYGAVSLSIGIQCKQSLIVALICLQYVLRITKVHFTSTKSKMRGPSRSSKSFRRAPLWCWSMAGSDCKIFLTICLI